MSPQRTHQLKVWIPIAAAVLGLCGSSVAYARSEFHAVMAAKVDTATYERDRAVRAVSDSAWHEVLLDVLCSKNVDPHNRRCPPR